MSPQLERKIAAQWKRWEGWVCLDLRRRGRDAGISSPEFMRLRQRHSEQILDLMLAGISMRTIRSYRLDDPRITDEVRTMLVEAVKKRQSKERRLEEKLVRNIAAADPYDGMVLDPQAFREVIQAIRLRVVEHFYMREMRDPELQVRTNRRAYVLPRQFAMYIARQLTGATLEEIGREFGGRHHSTVLHSINKIEKMRRTDDALNSTIARMMSAVIAQS